MESDETLFLRVREGDIAAFDRLYERYERRLFTYVLAMLRDRRDAEEVFHDAFLAALKDAAPTFEDGGFRAWLYRVARNIALNRKRSRDRHDRNVASAEPFVAPSSNKTADRLIEARELDTALLAAVARLPHALGELYHLRADGLSYEQIANVIDVPLGTVKSRMHQMVHALRQELSPWIAPK